MCPQLSSILARPLAAASSLPPVCVCDAAARSSAQSHIEIRVERAAQWKRQEGSVYACALLATILQTRPHRLTTLRGLIDEQVEFLTPPKARSLREVSVASSAVSPIFLVETVS